VRTTIYGRAVISGHEKRKHFSIILRKKQQRSSSRDSSINNEGEMLVGYTVTGYDNGTVMFEDNDPSLARCPACGFRTDFFAHNPFYRQGRKRRSDLLSTYDNADIVTLAFQSFCLDNLYEGVKFLEFKNDSDHFHLQVDRVIPFNAKKRGTRCIDYCPACENYKSVIGADPAYLEIEKPLKDGFYRSDLLFANGNGKAPLLIVGCETKSKMEAAKLKGLIFEEAYN
jgi:hypothetical protein